MMVIMEEEEPKQSQQLATTRATSRSTKRLGSSVTLTFGFVLALAISSCLLNQKTLNLFTEAAALLENQGWDGVSPRIMEVVPEPRSHTDAGVDVSDPALYEGGVNLEGDSTTATVMGLATGYSLKIYKQFVGSLRKTGYKGHIILGVAPDMDPEIVKYLEYRDVIVKKLQWANCTYPDSKRFQCSYPYSDIKTRWSRFPLQRDWLEECETCTGPVLTMDVRDAYFQLDPFGPGSPVVKGLQVYEEHKTQTTQHWLAQWPIQACKNVTFHETMLCSGSTVGTRTSMLKYFEVMYEEMKVWINNPKCRFTIHGDDQSMHNYLFYSGQLPFATPIANRQGGIVNTVGVEGSKLWDKLKKKGGKDKKYKGAGGERWIGHSFNLTDDAGYFTEFDGSRSRAIHQFDRLGTPLNQWLLDHGFQDDPMPAEEEVLPPIAWESTRQAIRGLSATDQGAK